MENFVLVILGYAYYVVIAIMLGCLIYAHKSPWLDENI